MNYEKMWKKLKRNLVADSGNMSMDAGSLKYCKRTLISMSRIESEEEEKDCKAGEQTYSVHQDITGRMDIKVPDIGKLYRETFERITGRKVIESLEELESEIKKRRGKTLLSDAREKIIVDEKVDIPSYIKNEADVHGIKILMFRSESHFFG